MESVARRREAKPDDRIKSIRINEELHHRLRQRALDDRKALYELAEEILEWGLKHRPQAIRKSQGGRSM